MAIFGLKLPIFLPESRGWAIIRVLVIIRIITVPCIQVGLEDKARKVTAANDFTIPGHSEAVIEVYVDRQVQDDLSEQTDFLIEPTEHFMNAYPCRWEPP